MIAERKRLLITLLTVVVLLSSCSPRPDRDDKDQTPVPSKTQAPRDGSVHLTPQQAQAIGIKTVVVQEERISTSIDAIGRVVTRPGSEAQVFAPFSGRLIVDPATVPRLGSTVTKGQALAQIEQLLNATEQTQVRANIAQLNASIVQAQQEVTFRKTEMDRTRQLYNQGGMALKQLQTAEFNFNQAQAQLEGAKHAKNVYEAAESLQASGTRRVPIAAPISGTVVAVDLTPGQMTDPAKNLMTIIDLRTVWVEAPVNESDLRSVQSARNATVVTPANPDRSYSGKVITIGSVVDPVNRTIEVIIAADNRDASLKIGMTAEIKIPTGANTMGFIVPASAVLLSEGMPTVYVETGQGDYTKRRVVAGQRFGDAIAVTSGLNSGERIVTIGGEALLGASSKSELPSADED